jgi:type II secretory ATPase GspE/PulE/Tfp pilus assembly ATPase PilB-like protein
VSIRFQIDGIWHAMAAMDREKGDYMLASLKRLAGLNYRDRRSRQEGSFRADYLRRKTPCRIVSQGVRTGERVAIYLDVPQPKLENLEDLGMRESMRNELARILSETGVGMTLVCAMPGEGYTTTWRAVLSSCDRFTRDYYVLEEKSRVEPEVINISSVTYDEAAGGTPFTGMPQLLLREPQFIAFSEVANGKILDEICDLSAQQDFPVLTRIHGKNALDGLLRLMLLKSDHAKLLETLNAVVAMRLIRKLCEACRVSYRPHPMMLQKLGIPQGRIHQMYKPFIYQPEMVDEDGKEIEVCTNCHGIGYLGRTGIFELLKLTDPIRQVLLDNPNMNQLMAEARKQGHVMLRDEGIVLVARGVTSIEELQRILKV